MQFFIIDNEEDDLTYLRTTVAEAFPDSTVAPEKVKTFRSWPVAVEYLRKHMPQTADVVLLMDIALGDGERENLVTEGIHRCEALRREFPMATVVACTQFDRSVRDRPEFATVFHGLFEKQVWDRYPTLSEKAKYAREVIQQALPKDFSASERLFERARIQDSLGVRTFESVFGADALKEVLYHFAAGQDDVRLRSLSGGLSGAFLFEILGTGQNGRNAILVKIARDRTLIENEVKGLERYYGALGRLATHIQGPQSSDIRRLRSGGFYLEQASIPGDDLLRLATRTPPIADEEIRRFRDLLIGCIKEADSIPEWRMEKLGLRLPFKPLDFSRLKTSLDFLRSFGEGLVASGVWPADVPTAADVADSIGMFAEKWRDNSLNALAVDVPTMVQHGDAHLANVLLTRTGQQVLVDIARVGVWPVGYDVSRLAVQMRLRLPDHIGRADHLPSKLPLWLSQRPGTETGSAGSVCALADECDSAFFDAVRGLPQERALRIAYLCCTTWDLMKIASYGDISTFKRIWALVTVYRLSCDIEGLATA